MKLSSENNITISSSKWTLKTYSINLRIGGINLLTGPNGSGKSNFLKLLSGSLKPDCSFYAWIEEDYKALKIHGYYQPIGFDPQLSLLQNEKLWTIKGLNKNIDNSRLERCKEEFDLKRHYSAKWGKCSSGTRQKFAIAQTLCAEVDLYYLDEPLAHVDHDTAIAASNLMKEMTNEDKTFLIATHLESDFSISADRFLQIKDGQLSHLTEK